VHPKDSRTLPDAHWNILVHLWAVSPFDREHAWYHSKLKVPYCNIASRTGVSLLYVLRKITRC